MASPFIIDHPSPPVKVTTAKPSSPSSPTSTEAFPDIPSSPISKSSPGSVRRGHSNTHLEVSGSPQQPQRPVRPFRSASQRLPSTAFLESSRNGSHNELTTPIVDNAREREEQPQQRLLRPLPAPSLSGPSIRPSSSIAPGLLRGSMAKIARPTTPNAEELKSESIWADMQRTLADVELSAMKSSHLFNAPHSRALEKLRETQLALAQAWARSEADETAGQDSEDEAFTSEPEGGLQAGALSFRTAGVEPSGPATKNAKGKGGKEAMSKTAGVEGRHRKGSAGSNVGRDLEEETERDIKLARKRREANDNYFSQVNRGVLDVVSRLDEVASAMRTVERESRAVWNEMAGHGDGSTTGGSVTELDGDPDDDERNGTPLVRKWTTATETGTGSGTELSDSPVTPKKTAAKKPVKAETAKDRKKVAPSPKEKGR